MVIFLMIINVLGLENITQLLYYTALSSIGLLDRKTYGYETYFEIPENKESHFDVIYRNVKLNTDFECVLDVAVQYKEELRRRRGNIFLFRL